MNKVLAELLALLKVSMENKMTSFYQGEVVIVPQNYCPALMVYGKRTSIEAKDTCKDKYTYEIIIKIKTDITRYFDTEGNQDGIIQHQLAMINFFEELDSSYNLKDDTVLGTLRNRNNVSGTSYIFTDDFAIDYETTRDGQFFYITGTMSIVATELIERPTT